MLTEYCMGAADSSVRRVYSCAGQTRVAVTLTSAHAGWESKGNRSPAIDNQILNIDGRRTLRQPAVAAFKDLGGRCLAGPANVSTTVYRPPCLPEFQYCGQLRRCGEQILNQPWAISRPLFPAIPPGRSNLR